MPHKRIGGWLIKDKLYLVLKIANELWYYSRKGDKGEKQMHLLFVGWYELPGGEAKLFTFNVLWVSIQLGFKRIC